MTRDLKWGFQYFPYYQMRIECEKFHGWAALNELTDGVLAFMDKYLDVILTTSGDVLVDDKEELDAAYRSGEFTEEQYEAALLEGQKIIDE